MASSSPEMPDEAPDGASSEGGFSEAARPATKKAPRPPGKAPAGKEWDSDAGCWKEIDDLPISDLEKRRLKQIEENEARLLALGLGPSPLIDKAPRRKSHKRTWEVDEDVKGSLRARMGSLQTTHRPSSKLQVFELPRRPLLARGLSEFQTHSRRAEAQWVKQTSG